MGRRSYEGVAVAIPVTVPYVRYSIRAAHWWLARCLADLLKTSGLKKDDIDGLSVSSFTLAPDTAIGLTQHVGLSPRWLDHVPFGGASGVVMLRRAARAVPAGDAGADAFLVLTEERAKALGLRHARLLGTIERHNAFASDPVQMRAGWALDRSDLYEQAGTAPEEMDFVQTYDDYPVISLMQLEDLGFCGKGEGPAFVRKHSFTWDGSFPVNTGGGQLSVGQAGAAGGFLGMVEAIRQLTGQADARQV